VEVKILETHNHPILVEYQPITLNLLLGLQHVLEEAKHELETWALL
jgi:hypothetical protein